VSSLFKKNNRQYIQKVIAKLRKYQSWII